MKVQRTYYPGWHTFPAYICKTMKDWHEVEVWMRQCDVDHFMLASGSGGYTFQVRTNHDWFVLRWL